MRTVVAKTSIDAFYSQDFTGLQGKVLTALKVLGSSCIADLAAYLNIERSTVSARLNELKKMSQCPIVMIGKRKSQTTGITSEFYRARQFKEVLF